MTDLISVFVSYSWGVEADTGIVDELEDLCPSRNIKLIRDKNILKHGDLINQFMESLSGGEHIITIFSKAYFRSKWCMYELLRIWLRGDFLGRTHPIIADDCDLQDAEYRISVVDYWLGEHRKIQGSLKGRDPGLFVKEYENANLLRDISQQANELMNFAAGRLTTPLSELKDKNFAPLLDRIQSKFRTKVKTELQSDYEFLNEVRENIEIDLKRSESFRDQLIKNCGIDFGQTGQLSEHLINQCVAGEFVTIIQNIQSAFVDCSDELESDDVIALKKLHQAAEGTISKLVLFNVKNEWMAQYRQSCSTPSRNEYTLPKMSVSGVEVISSREARTIPKFHMDKHSFNLQGGKGVALEAGFRSKDVVRDVIKRLYTKVMERELSDELDETKAVSVLRKTIQQRKQQKNLKLRKNYFLLLPDDAGSSLSDEKVQKKLKSLLPELAFIRLKSDSHEETFIVEDEDLMVAISELFNTLEEHKPE
ncbi:MAG: toll/interleukin-1 receptor domain-containing protein [Chromatiales bacterium]